MPHTVAAVVTSKLASLHELDTVYGIQDLWDLLEINAVDIHNKNLMSANG